MSGRCKLAIVYLHPTCNVKAMVKLPFVTTEGVCIVVEMNSEPATKPSNIGSKRRLGQIPDGRAQYIQIKGQEEVCRHNVKGSSLLNGSVSVLSSV
jgi:hypothetical protein